MAALGEPLLTTVEQFDALPERKDALVELHWGHSVILSRPKAWHVKLQMKIAELLRPLAGERAYIITELPFRAIAEYDLRAADVAVVLRERWDRIEEGDLMGAPEVVVEILSPSNTKDRLREYAALCLANGCQDFWTVDRTQRSVTATNRQGQSMSYTAGQAVPLTALDGRTVSVDDIFR